VRKKRNGPGLSALLLCFLTIPGRGACRPPGPPLRTGSPPRRRRKGRTRPRPPRASMRAVVLGRLRRPRTARVRLRSFAGPCPSRLAGSSARLAHRGSRFAGLRPPAAASVGLRPEALGVLDSCGRLGPAQRATRRYSRRGLARFARARSRQEASEAEAFAPPSAGAAGAGAARPHRPERPQPRTSGRLCAPPLGGAAAPPQGVAPPCAARRPNRPPCRCARARDPRPCAAGRSGRACSRARALARIETEETGLRPRSSSADSLD